MPSRFPELREHGLTLRRMSGGVCRLLKGAQIVEFRKWGERLDARYLGCSWHPIPDLAVAIALAKTPTAISSRTPNEVRAEAQPK